MRTIRTTMSLLQGLQNNSQMPLHINTHAHTKETTTYCLLTYSPSHHRSCFTCPFVLPTFLPVLHVFSDFPLIRGWIMETSYVSRGNSLMILCTFLSPLTSYILLPLKSKYRREFSQTFNMLKGQVNYGSNPGI